MIKKYNEKYESFLKRFCDNLSLALKESGLSQRKQMLAGLDPRYIARIKKGEGNPTITTIWRICKVAGIEPGKLFE